MDENSRACFDGSVEIAIHTQREKESERDGRKTKINNNNWLPEIYQKY